MNFKIGLTSAYLERGMNAFPGIEFLFGKEAFRVQYLN
jgi:hypothetical protein